VLLPCCELEPDWLPVTAFVPFVFVELLDRLESLVLVPVPTVVLVDVSVPPCSVDVFVAQPANNAAAAKSAMICFIIRFSLSSMWTVQEALSVIAHLSQ
jgi:hypothetical protein